MEDIIDIIVTETTNLITITSSGSDEVIDVNIIDNREDIVLNVTPSVVEININSLTGNFGVNWGEIAGTLSNQTDLNTALGLKADLVGGKVPSSQLPSYVDDVVEVANYAALPATGETGKIYVVLDTNKIYRWSGSAYVEIVDSAAVWGAITGTLSSQTDLQSALNAKFDDPTGDTTQYIAGDGSLITFPVAGQAGTLVREVRNTTGATLTKGTIVYISGATGNKPTVSKAIATGDSTSAQTFGMLQANIANNANGYAVCVGDLSGLDTSGIAEGTQLYLSGVTAGAYTTTKSVAPIHLVYIGVVTRSHPTQGQIEVKIQNGYELDEIHDVLITSKANNDGLFYESSTDLWKNKSIATVLGGTPITGTGTTNYVPKFTGTTALGNSNIQDSGSLITLGSNTTISSGALGIGTSSLTGYNLRVSKNITGATTSIGIHSDGTIQSDVTGAAYLMSTNGATVAASFTLNALTHYRAAQATFGSGSTVTSQYGFSVDSSMTGATNNYGFFGNIASGSNRYNLYMAGTAGNYLGGSLGIGAFNITNTNLFISKTMTGSVDSYHVNVNGTIQSDVTSSASYFRSSASTAAASFTVGSLYHYVANQGSFGAGSNVGTQVGFRVNNNLTSATNNYGFFGDIASGTNRWNLYMNGTANNYLAGNLIIGATADTGQKLQVTGTATISSSITANSFIKTSGTSAQFLKADGSVDSSTYALDSAIVHLNGTETIAGLKTITNNLIIRPVSGYNAYFQSSLSAMRLNFVDDGLTTNVSGAFRALDYSFQCSSTVVFTLNSSGYADFTGLRLKGTDSANTIYVGNQNMAITAEAGYNISIGKASDVTKSLNVNTTNGNVLIGTTTDNGIKFQVSGDIYSSGYVYFKNNASTNNFAIYGSTNILIYNSAVGNIANINASTGIYTPTSDKNKKKDFEVSNIGLYEVMQLKPTLYRMKTDDTNGQKELGFIAQEVKECIPNAYVESDGFIGLNFNPIVAALTKAVQELKAELDTLKNK